MTLERRKKNPVISIFRPFSLQKINIVKWNLIYRLIMIISRFTFNIGYDCENFDRFMPLGLKKIPINCSLRSFSLWMFRREGGISVSQTFLVSI